MPFSGPVESPNVDVGTCRPASKVKITFGSICIMAVNAVRVKRMSAGHLVAASTTNM